jgi:hypothetical protein
MRSLGAVDAVNLDGGGSHGDAFAPLCPYRGSLVQTVPRVLLWAGGEGGARRSSGFLKRYTRRPTWPRLE